MLGLQAGSNGMITVDGAGSKLEIRENVGARFDVGGAGTGLLSITNGGQASSVGTIHLGRSVGGSGTVHVDGANSSLQGNATIFVGHQGVGVLNITRGATVTATSHIYLGYDYIDSSSSGTVMVGAGSSLSASDVFVGGNEISGMSTGFLAGTGTVTAGGGVGVRIYSPGTLSAGDAAGAIGTLTIVGNLELRGRSTLHVDFNNAGAAAGTNQDHINVSGDVEITYDMNISLSSLATTMVTGTPRTVVTAGGTISGTPVGGGGLRLNGLSLAGSRADGSTVTLAKDGANKLLQITAMSITGAANKNVTWTGADATNPTYWNITTKNWTDDDNGAADITFLDGDAVTFANTAATTVNIQGTQKTVAQMLVTGSGDLTINGKIVADGTQTTLAAQTGKLLKQGTGTLTLNGENEFKNGVEMTSGTILLGHDRALGVWTAGDPAITQTGMLLATTGASTVKVTEDRTITNHFQLGRRDGSNAPTDPDATLTFDIAAGATLTITGVENTNTTDYLGSGGAINVNVFSANGTTSPLKFTGGHLVFADNKSARYGGAVGAYFSGGYQHSALDFQGLESVTFTGNIAGKAGAGHGGGIYSYSYTNPSSVTLGDWATFTGNIAGNAGDGGGGGIQSHTPYYSSSVTLGAGATFTGNIAGNGGDGDGGGILSVASSSSSVTLGGGATFTGNIAGNAGYGYGGGIHSTTYFSTSVTLGAGATFTGNIAGNAGYGLGGGIFSAGLRSTSSSSVTLGDGATFTGNIAGKTDYGYGGGIYSFIANSPRDAPSSVTLGDGATFTGNIAGKAGNGYGGGISSGAVYATGVPASILSANPIAPSSVTLGDGATFTGNVAGDAGRGYGGAILSWGSPGTVALGSGAYLTGNRAGGGNGGGLGGAIYASTDVSLRGDTFFSGNLVSWDAAGTVGSLGGAIYVNGETADRTITLDTETATGVYAPIAFAGNKVNVDTNHINAIDPTTGTANAIHLEKNTLLEIKGDGNVYFDDPISSGTDGNNSLTKTGAGFVQFVGASTLNDSTAAGGGVTVSGGAFRVVSGASFATGGNDGQQFTVEAGGTLAGAGTITSANGFTISGTLSPDADRFAIPEYVDKTHADATPTAYNYFRNERTELDPAKRTGTLTLAGAVTLDGATLAVDVGTSTNDQIAVNGAVTFGTNANTVAVTGGAQGATYDILTATSAMTLADDDFNAVTGTGANGYSYTRGSAVHLKTDDAKTLQLTLDSTQNTTFTWTGATDADWSTLAADANWTDGVTGGETRFMAGDAVAFDSSDTTNNRTITLAAATTVASMAVSGAGSYTFSGAALTGAAAGTTITGATGALTKSGTGTLTFNNAASFASAAVTGGALAVGNAQTLTVTGATSFGDGTTFRHGASLGLDTGSLVIGTNTTYDVTGYTGPAPVTVITSGTVISGGFTTVKIGGVDQSGLPTTSIEKFVNTAILQKSADEKSYAITAGGLVWNNTAPGTAHGTFHVETTYDLAENLVDNAVAAAHAFGWDGKSLTKTGTGTLTLSGTNTYTGATTVSAGTLALSGSGSIADSNELVVASGAAFDISGATNPVSLKALSGSGSVLLGAQNLSVGSGNTSTTFSGVMSGNGGLTKTGAGTLTLSGTNTFTGATTVSAGTLALSGSGSLADSNELAVASGAAFDISGATNPVSLKALSGSGSVLLGAQNLSVGSGNTSTTFSGVMSGNGGLTKTGTGVLTLSGTNTYAGGTTVSGGLVNFNGVGNFGTGNITLNGGGLQWATGNTADISSKLNAIGTGGGTFDTNGNNVALATALTGSGGLTKTGTGTLTLSGTNTFTGATTVSAGTLALSGSGSLADSNELAVASGTAFDISGATSPVSLKALSGSGSVLLGSQNLSVGSGNTSTTFSGVMTGSGGLTKTGTGTLTLSGTNTFTGATTVSAGTLALSGSGSLADSNELAVASGAAFDISGATNPVSLKALSGSGSVLLGSQNLSVGSGNTNTAFSGVMSGNGGLTKTGTGTLTLSGTNTFTGATTVSAGTLALSGSGSLADSNELVVASGTAFDMSGATNPVSLKALSGSGSVLLGSQNLSVGSGNTSTTFSGVMTGSGGVTKTGAGTLTLSGTNTYAGGTTVSAGTLQLGANGGSASLASAVKVASGATFSGNGTVAGLTVSGTLSPGDATAPYGALNVTGNLSFNAGAFYAVDLGLDNGAADALTVGDTVAIDAAAKLTVATIDGTATSGATRIIAADASRFDGTLFLLDNSWAVAFSQSIDADGYYLSWDRTATYADLATSGRPGPNMRSLARTFDRATANGVATTGELADALSGIWLAADQRESWARLNELSPSVLAGGTELDVMAADGFRTDLDKLWHVKWLDDEAWNATASAPAASSADAWARLAANPADRGWRFWGEVGGAWSEYDSPNGDPGHTAKEWTATVAGYRTFGAAGCDAWSFGAALNANHTRLDWEHSLGETKGDSFAGALLAMYERGPWFVAADAVWGTTDVESRRRLPLAGLRANADYRTHWYGADLTAGYRARVGAWSLTPSGGARWYRYNTPGVTEKGAGTAGLTMAKDHRTGVELFARLDVSRTWTLANGVSLTPRGFLDLSAEAADRWATPAMNFAGAPAGLEPFRDYSPKGGRVAGQVGLGLEAKFRERWTVYGEYTGEFRDREQRHAGQLGLGLAF